MNDDRPKGLTERAAIRALAEKIARYLFTSGSGQRATRLVLEMPNNTDCGGWCEKAVADRIETLLGGEQQRKDGE